MAIAEMQKISLVGMGCEKSALLDVLQRTGAVEIKAHSEMNGVLPVPVETEGLEEYAAAAESALELLQLRLSEWKKSDDIPADVFKNGFSVSYSEFMAQSGQREQIDRVVSRIQELEAERVALSAKEASLQKRISAVERYRSVGGRIGDYADTLHTCCRLGLIPEGGVDVLKGAFSQISLAEYRIFSDGGKSSPEFAPALLVYHKSVAAECERAASEAGFSPCDLENQFTVEEILSRLDSERLLIADGRSQNKTAFLALAAEVKPLKVYCDYLAYALEKKQADEKFLKTEKTFFLEGYVPTACIEKVDHALSESELTVYFEFSPVGDEDDVPTLTKNNALVSNFEVVTNVYSPPNYREIDPNAVMALFYSIFMGFIIGDAGYGILMAVVGGILGVKKRGTGFGKLCMVFAVGGVVSVVWGLLFNSFFGVKLPIPSVLPDPQNDTWNFVGIDIPAVLVLSLMVGVVQLFAGYVMRAAQYFRRGQIGDGICFGISWAVFSLGVFLALFGLTAELNVSVLATVGGIIAGVSLLFAVVTAGKGQKFGKKIVKSFGALYGIINYVSDVLSYARLYGLMLSGAIIAQIVSQYSLGFIASGNVFAAAGGVALLAVGHLFNIAINLLGAYIHDSRLQYVEFFGRFFEGEGRLFTPLGSQRKYVSVGDEMQAQSA